MKTMQKLFAVVSKIITSSFVLGLALHALAFVLIWWSSTYDHGSSSRVVGLYRGMAWLLLSIGYLVFLYFDAREEKGEDRESGTLSAYRIYTVAVLVIVGIHALVSFWDTKIAWFTLGQGVVHAFTYVIACILILGAAFVVESPVLLMVLVSIKAYKGGKRIAKLERELADAKLAFMFIRNNTFSLEGDLVELVGIIRSSKGSATAERAALVRVRTEIGNSVLPFIEMIGTLADTRKGYPSKDEVAELKRYSWLGERLQRLFSEAEEASVGTRPA